MSRTQRMFAALPVAAMASAGAVSGSGGTLALTPGHAALRRVNARGRSELVVGARAERCTHRLAITVDGRRPVVVAVGGRAASHAVAALRTGWHRVAVRVPASGCRGRVVISSLTAEPTAPSPAPPPPAAGVPLPGSSTAGAPEPTWPAPPTAPVVATATSAPPAPAPPPPAPPSAPPSAPSPSAAPGSGNPFAGARLYVDPESDAAQTESAWRAEGRIADAETIAKIAVNPQAEWFGDWNGADPSADVRAAVSEAAAAGTVPVLVAYDIPGRDCAGYSAGGAGSAAAYRNWIDGFANGIGSSRAVVVVEPDALAELDCLGSADQQTTLSLLSYAVGRLTANPGTGVYLDAGHSGWQPPSVIAARLEAAGVAQARGFALNVSNFDATTSELAYGDSISQLVGGRHFIVDTSRNGQGSDGQWCNPPGAGLGQPYTTGTGDPLADALLWIKPPGESDGTCNGGPAAGTWWPDYARGLAQRAAF